MNLAMWGEINIILQIIIIIVIITIIIIMINTTQEMVLPLLQRTQEARPRFTQSSPATSTTYKWKILG